MEGISERFQALVESSPDATSLLNAQGQVLYASAATAKVLGYEPQELLGCSGLDLLHPDDRDHSVRTFKRVMAEPQSHRRVQARFRQKDGHWRWVESTASNLLDDPRVGAIVVNYRQIDERRADEVERQHVVEELNRSNIELRAFAVAVAHDLKEPLRTIGAFTEILVGRSGFSEADKELARYIITGVQRMSRLVDGALSAATFGPEC